MKKDKSSDEITNASKVIEIRSRFKKLCESLHLNSKQLARLCGIADATIYRLEGRLSDHARITHTTLKRICEGTGANIDWLMGEVEKPMFIIEPDMLRVEDAEGSRQRLREYREKLGMTLEEFATHAYYTSVTEAAALTYDAVEITGKGLTPQLGINPIDPDNNSIFIQTLGAYDIEHFIGSAQSANYIRCDIQLKTIDDGYTDALVIADYIDKRTFSIMDETTPVSSIQGDNDTTWTFIYDKDDLELKGNIYQIPIDFAPLTGVAFEAGNTRKYANYGLFLKVSMLVNENDANPIAKSDPAADYVKWTNARITTEQVTP